MKLFIQASAQDDILRQFERYLEQGLPDIAERFSMSIETSIEALLKTPHAGAQKETVNPKLSGLRTWPVKSFDEYRIFYIVNANVIQILRVLHGKRDIRPIIEEQEIDNLDV